MMEFLLGYGVGSLVGILLMALVEWASTWCQDDDSEAP